MQFEFKEVLIQRGKESRYLYFLVSGRVQFAAGSLTERSFSHGYSRVGDCIGEVGSLWSNPPQVTVLVVHKSLFVAIDLDVHRERLLNDNTFLRFICRRLADNVLSLNKNIVRLSQAAAPSRIASCILRNLTQDRLTITLRECARQTAVSCRHLIRIINRFANSGLIIREGRRYHIVNHNGLAEMADTWEPV